MRLHRAVLSLAVFCTVVALPACDSTEPETLTFQNIEIEQLGGATARVENGRLVVTGIGASGGDGIGIWQDLSSAYLTFEPIALPADGAFGVSVRDTNNDFVTSISSEADGVGRHDIVFEVADRFDIQTVTLQYLLGGELIVEIPDIALPGDQALKVETTAGSGEGDNGSVRVVRSGGRYVVGQDYSGDEELSARDIAEAVAKGECPGALITLPFVLDGPQVICADLVQVVIEDEGLPTSIRGAAVTGRGLGEFVVTSVNVDDRESF